jgi:hypothetical protein
LGKYPIHHYRFNDSGLVTDAITTQDDVQVARSGYLSALEIYLNRVRSLGVKATEEADLAIVGRNAIQDELSAMV